MIVCTYCGLPVKPNEIDKHGIFEYVEDAQGELSLLICKPTIMVVNPAQSVKIENLNK